MGRTHRFPPYELLEGYEPSLADGVARAEEKTAKLERLYHNTQAYAWEGRTVLDALVKEHGGVHVPEDKREAIGRLFTVILWGELAAWNVAADLARDLPETDAKMAATGQVFDEARHFYVLRDYLRRANVPLPPINPLVRRVLVRLLETDSVVQKLSGMQLLVENLALAIFKRVADAKIEPVLTGLLPYIERDESRHVGLGVMYLPKLLARASPYERAKLWAFSVEMFALTVMHGRRLDPDFRALGMDHRELALTAWRNNEQVIRQMREHFGLQPGERVEGVYMVSKKQHTQIVDFLHPEDESSIGERHRRALTALDAAVTVAEKVFA